MTSRDGRLPLRQLGIVPAPPDATEGLVVQSVPAGPNAGDDPVEIGRELAAAGERSVVMAVSTRPSDVERLLRGICRGCPLAEALQLSEGVPAAE